MSDPVVEQATNEDGSTTTKTTWSHPNGSPKKVVEEKVDENGVVRLSVERNYKKGDSEENPGPCEGVQETERDANGSVVRKKKSEFMRRGQPAEDSEVWLDEHGRITRARVVIFRKSPSGSKSQEKDTTIEYANGKARMKTVVTITYCPPGSRCDMEVKTTEVFDWAGQKWRRNKSKCKIEKWTCETGVKKHTLLLPGGGGFLGGALCCVVAVGFGVVVYLTDVWAYLIGSFGAIAVALVLFWLARRDCIRRVNVERAFSAPYDEDPSLDLPSDEDSGIEHQ